MRSAYSRLSRGRSESSDQRCPVDSRSSPLEMARIRTLGPGTSATTATSRPASFEA